MCLEKVPLLMELTSGTWSPSCSPEILVSAGRSKGVNKTHAKSIPGTSPQAPQTGDSSCHPNTWVNKNPTGCKISCPLSPFYQFIFKALEGAIVESCIIFKKSVEFPTGNITNIFASIWCLFSTWCQEKKSVVFKPVSKWAALGWLREKNHNI